MPIVLCTRDVKEFWTRQTQWDWGQSNLLARVPWFPICDCPKLLITTHVKIYKYVVVLVCYQCELQYVNIRGKILHLSLSLSPSLCRFVCFIEVAIKTSNKDMDLLLIIWYNN